MNDKPRLQVMQALDGETAIGFERRDVPMVVHVIVQAPPGTRVGANGEISTHLAMCLVCKAHDVTHADFVAFMATL